ncbi:glutamate receptor ionotropic, kainate 3-like isoform X2 [Scylla paramamosain]|uniref:glutamate receptor ionotropic, kainate 3-like isoform X2 n=1 Tax=Scylla paramamosain TaxID=85552 RepID=UPI003082EA3E
MVRLLWVCLMLSTAAATLLPDVMRGDSRSQANLRRLLPRHAPGVNATSYLREDEGVRRIELLLSTGQSAAERERRVTMQRKAKTKELLEGHVMTIVLKHRLPYVSLKLDGRRVLGASGILIELLHSLTRLYNFSYTMKLPDDDQWGSINSEGKWNGMVGEVHRYEMDMALGPTSITEEREKAIDFTTPFDFEPWDIMIAAAGENVDLATFLMPFNDLVWVGLLVSWALVGSLTVLLSHPLSGFPRASTYPYRHAPRPVSLLRSLLDNLGSLTSQSVTQPQTEATRVLAAWWWVFSVITIASYSSKLISSITVRFSNPGITSMLQMVETRSMLWTYQANSAMEELFKDASLLEMAIASDLAIHGSCRMSLVKDHFFSTRFGMILQRGSPYRDAFSLNILQFLDTGLMDAWKKRFWPVASRCVSGTKKQPVRALNLLDAAGTLLLLLGGALLASTLLLGEILLGRMISNQD